MSIDGPNLQGFNLRQVAVQGEQAAQVQGRREGVDPREARPHDQVAQFLARSNQSVESTDRVVDRQDDQPDAWNRDDALTGGDGRGGAGDGGDSPARGRGRGAASDGLQGPPRDPELLAVDPDEACTRLASALPAVPRGRGSDVFFAPDRGLLAGLLAPAPTSRTGTGIAAYRHERLRTADLTASLELALRGCRDRIGQGDLESARRLLALVRGGCRAERPGPGRDLAAILEHLLEATWDPCGVSAQALSWLEAATMAVVEWRNPARGGRFDA